MSPAVPTVNKAPCRRLRPQCGRWREAEVEEVVAREEKEEVMAGEEKEEVMVGEEKELGGCYSREKTAGNDKGCKYLPLPGPGSCAELTGPHRVAGE